jgi:hypothetical protein
VVEWSVRGRLIVGAFIPVFALLSRWSFVSETHPRPVVGVLAAGATLVAVLVQLHAARYRVIATAEGVVERTFLGTRIVAWRDVLEVEYQAQVKDGDSIRRWRAEPHEAFHVLLRTAGRTIAVHRWMNGLDAFIDAVERHRDAMSGRAPATGPIGSPASHVAMKALSAVAMARVVVIVALLSFVFGVVVVAGARLELTGSPLVDMGLVALLPWGLFLGVWWLASRSRRARFGDDEARPPVGAKDIVGRPEVVRRALTAARTSEANAPAMMRRAASRVRDTAPSTCSSSTSNTRASSGPARRRTSTKTGTPCIP